MPFSFAADGGVGDHAAHGQLHSLGGALSHQGGVLGGLQVTDPAGVTLPLLLLQLVAGQDSLSAVDDDDVVTAIDVGGEGGLVLAAQQNSGLGSHTTQGFAGGVDDVPLTLDLTGLSHKSHSCFLLFCIVGGSASDPMRLVG